MAAAITKAGESLIAQKQAAGEVLEVVRFVLALVPDLDPDQPVDRDGLKPPPDQIVHTQAFTQRGFVNPNQVIYSLMMGSDVGDFDWNWIGLETAEDVLLSVAYVPIQQKRKNIPPHQIGNNVTRNFLVVFDGAQALTAITVDASTWQHDFTVRLAGIDERERQGNHSLYGAMCFFSSGWKLEKTESGGFHLLPGVGYVKGIRLESSVPQVVPPPPAEIGYAWLDVWMSRELNDNIAKWKIVYALDLEDYVDADGVPHYCAEIAMVKGDIPPDDRRAYESFGNGVIRYYAARDGDYPELRARATTKDDVGLGELPNAKSDDPATDSSEILATTAALNNLNQQISDSLVGMVAAFDMETAPPGWLKRNGADVSRTAYAKLFAVIGTRYGEGDGSTTFNVGDSRGVFTRGLDEGRGLDPDRILGSLQQSQNLLHDHTASSAGAGTHNHSGNTLPGGAHGHTGNTSVDGNHNHPFNFNNTPTSGDQPGIGAAMHHVALGNVAGDRIQAGGDHSHQLVIHGAPVHIHEVSIVSNGEHVHTVTVDATGGHESRPINQALLICIKY